VTTEVRDGRPPHSRRPTRRGLLLGAGLASLGGVLAGCSTAAVPYGADEAGVLEDSGPAPSSVALPVVPASPTSTQPSPQTSAEPTRHGKARGSDRQAELTGVVLGYAREIPVGGGKIFDTERVVVTQPASGTYRAFSAVCTHVGCLLNVVADGTIDCPCHGSKFKISNGAVVTGPAPTPLPKKRITVLRGTILLL
jgi:Rieske Fe-S protein